jgi:hypothetical protein
VTEQVTVAVTLMTCNWEMMGLGLGQYIRYSDGNVRWLSSVPRFGHYRFLLYSFQFFLHHSSYHWTQYGVRH